MSDKPTKEQMLALADAIAKDPWYYLTDVPGAIDNDNLKEIAEAIRARLSEHDGLADRLAKAEAALAEQKPLVEAVMASDLKANGPAAREPGKAWCSGQSLKAILQAALAYREKQDKKEEGK